MADVVWSVGEMHHASEGNQFSFTSLFVVHFVCTETHRIDEAVSESMMTSKTLRECAKSAGALLKYDIL